MMRLSLIRPSMCLPPRPLCFSATLSIVSLFVSMPAWAQAAQNKPIESGKAVRMRICIPSYYYPFGPGLRDWNRLIASAKVVPIVAIVNPASGPGDHVDTNFAVLIPRARKAGVTVVAYIGTQYGRKPIARVKQEVDTFLRFYPEIQGFHFDEQSSDQRDVDYYAELYQYVHRRIPNALVITNPGTSCDPGYASRPAADIITLREHDLGFQDYQVPAWTARFSGLRFCIQAHSVRSEQEMKQSLRRAAELRIGNVFVTDDSGANPYDRLPSYWDAEVEVVRRVNLPTRQ